MLAQNSVMYSYLRNTRLGDFIFSPDGKDHAYLAFDGGKHFIVRRQGASLPVEGLNDGTLTFSPDGSHLAFVGIRDGTMGIWLDGKALPSDVPIAKTKNHGSLFFSPDSKRIAFAIEGPEKLHWVVDGRAGPPCSSVLGHFDFSPNSAHFAYVLPRPETKDVAIVVDGKVRAAYATVACGPVFCNDGTIEFLAAKDGALSRFRVTGY
jgi:Tol biopolymer transport system component